MSLSALTTSKGRTNLAMASSVARQGGRTRGRIGGYPVTAIAKRALLAFAVKSGLSTVQHHQQQHQQQQPTLATGHLPPPHRHLPSRIPADPQKYYRGNIFRIVLVFRVGVMIFRSRRYEQHKMRFIVTTVCLLATSVSPANPAEPIAVPFGLWTRVGPRNCVFGGSTADPPYGKFCGIILWHAQTCPRSVFLTLFASRQRCGLWLSVNYSNLLGLWLAFGVRIRLGLVFWSRCPG